MSTTTLRGGPLDGGRISTPNRHHEMLLFAADTPSHLWLIDPEPRDPPPGTSFHAYASCSRGHYHYEETLTGNEVLDLIARRMINLGRP